MRDKENRSEVILRAVCEQLGIEENEALLEEDILDLVYLNQKIEDLEHLLEKKDQTIHQLELQLNDESKRIDLLEQYYYEFRRMIKNK
ncbi:MAG: hypothetical protein JXR88_14910 [Clostridia bacterium]|nr:hypothetical protein [Clostridia bacterium]